MYGRGRTYRLSPEVVAEVNAKFMQWSTPTEIFASFIFVVVVFIIPVFIAWLSLFTTINDWTKSHKILREEEGSDWNSSDCVSCETVLQLQSFNIILKGSWSVLGKIWNFPFEHSLKSLFDETKILPVPFLRKP